jgi:hypothetical protein
MESVDFSSACLIVQHFTGNRPLANACERQSMMVARAHATH